MASINAFLPAKERHRFAVNIRLTSFLGCFLATARRDSTMPEKRDGTGTRSNRLCSHDAADSLYSGVGVGTCRYEKTTTMEFGGE